MAIIAISAVGASAAGDVAGFRGTAHGDVLRQLELMGHRIVNVEDEEATHYVSFDHNRSSFRAVQARIPADRRQLVIYEPRVVLPANYSRTVHAQYSNLVSFTHHVSGASGFLEWPQRDWRALPPVEASRHPGTTAVVNANKLSSIRGSLYGLRRRVIARFAAEGLPLTLAGPNWERRGGAILVENARAIAYAVINRELVEVREWARPVPTGGSVTHLGKVDDKEAVLLGAEFAVVIENSATYVSEKLFDAVIAGCVPLYVGPSLATYGIPESVAVVLPPRAEEFTNAVRTLSAGEKEAVLAAGRDWLASDETHERWAMPNALRRLAIEIDRAIQEKDTKR